MSAPAEGGRTLTLAPGKAAVLLTEYAGGDQAPLQIINLDVAGARVYLAADSSVSPSNGVPLDPGTSLPWSTPGQVWAIADPTSSSTATVVVSAAITDWQPSPAAIAAQVAAELLQQGIPNVLTETLIEDLVLPPSGISVELDVRGYASILLIMLDAPANSPVALDWHFTDDGETAVVAPGQWAQNTIAPTPIVIPVTGPRFVLGISAVDTNPSHTIRIYGSNRPVTRAHADALGYNPPGFECQFSGALVNGTPVQLMGVNGPSKGNWFAGPALVQFDMQATITPARFEFVTQTGQGQITMQVADTGETGWHTIGSTSPAHAGITKMIALPNQRFTVQMVPGLTTAGAVVTMRAIPAY